MLFFAKHHKNWTFCVNLKLFMVKMVIFWQRYKWTLSKTQERLKPHGRNSTFPQNQKLQLPGIGPICKPALKAKISLYVNRSRKVKKLWLLLCLKFYFLHYFAKTWAWCVFTAINSLNWNQHLIVFIVGAWFLLSIFSVIHRLN